MIQKLDPDMGRGRPAASQQERIQQAIASLRARAILPTHGEIGETGQWVAPASEAVTYVDDGTTDFGASLDVALLFADSAAAATAVTNVLLPDPRVSSVTAINTTTVTPTVNDMRAFDVVLVWTNLTPVNNVALGDNLADYVDAGGGCVLTMFAIRASVATRTIGGRFLNDNYYCIAQSVGATTTGNAGLGSLLEPASELLDGVRTFDGGTSSFRTPAATTTNAVRVANWSTGEALIAQRDDLAGGRVDLGFFAVPAPTSGASWLTTTDGGVILVNALAVASKQETCQRVFQQTPFSASGAIRNTNVPGASPNGDQQYADDFTLPTSAYISELTLWSVYTNGTPAPATQDFTIRIHEDNGGLPGAIVYTSAGLTVSYRNTGVTNTGTNTPIFETRISLSLPFLANGGTRYWLCPLGNNAGSTFAWNGTGAAGTSAVRIGDAGAWSNGTAGQMAFVLCTDCFRFGDSPATTFTFSDVTRGNIITVNSSQVLDSFNMELQFAANQTMWTYVMEANTAAGPYTPIYTRSALYAGGLGRFFYGTGDIHVVLRPNRFYYVGFGWNAQGTDFFRRTDTYPLPWTLGTRHGLGGQNGVTNPVAGAQTIIGPFAGGEYSMRMCFSVAGCEVNCDNSTNAPILNVNDFVCFNNRFAAAQALPLAAQIASYANCDNSTVVPVLNVNDFVCFNNKFAAGCP
ncbi:MAG: hypothetical protein JNM80_11695 [Phycisphaerae bacterium]|nr:hypothetical protein [Phycisphaerae bacterium]